VRQKIFALILAVVFVLSQTSVVDAKGFSRGFGGSKSFSKSFGSTFKTKSGYSGSSKSLKGLFSGSKKSTTSKNSGSGYSGSSSSRSVPGSYSTGSSTKASASNSKKSAYMQDAYKKQTSSANYSSYKQKMNAEQQKAYDSSTSGFNVNNRMNFENSANTRSQRINNMNSRPVYINARPGLFSGPMTWGMGYVGMWDMFFIMQASNLFWYHHWNEISPYRDNFDEKKFAEMEARVKELEKENNGVRDPNYMDPDVDPDLQLSKEYQEKNLDKVYYTDKYSEPKSNPASTVIVIILIGGVLLMVVSKAARP
jgi:hypothetical protein